MITFENDEDEYLSWLDKYPSGFVLNTNKRTFFMLHDAICKEIKDKGPHTTSEFIKKCSIHKDELTRWTAKRGGNLELCSVCEKRKKLAPVGAL